MADNQPHKAAFLAAAHENDEASYFLIGYIAGDVPDAILCEAIQAWRRHRAELAELMTPQDILSRNAVYDPRD